MWAALKPLADHSRRRGFTIVELLIVIVVIGILATIVIVAYGGIQKRARNVSVINTASEYRTIFMAYAAQNGQYPSGNTLIGYCLGSGYVDYNSDGIGDCVDNGSGFYVSENSSYNTMLKTVVVSLPNTTTTVYTRTSDSSKVSGIRYDYGANRTLNGVSNPYWIVYLIEDATSKCGSDTVQITTWPALSSSGGYPDVFGTSAVQCWLPLPTPS
jgi:prepilin-type N-terminal cleavage/methylation domain-containing protein